MIFLVFFVNFHEFGLYLFSQNLADGAEDQSLPVKQFVAEFGHFYPAGASPLEEVASALQCHVGVIAPSDLHQELAGFLEVALGVHIFGQLDPGSVVVDLHS